jgi:hypothetical protein
VLCLQWVGGKKKIGARPGKPAIAFCLFLENSFAGRAVVPFDLRRKNGRRKKFSKLRNSCGFSIFPYSTLQGIHGILFLAEAFAPS